jgi:hypothetical protein
LRNFGNEEEKMSFDDNWRAQQMADAQRNSQWAAQQQQQAWSDEFRRNQDNYNRMRNEMINGFIAENQRAVGSDASSTIDNRSRSNSPATESGAQSQPPTATSANAPAAEAESAHGFATGITLATLIVGGLFLLGKHLLDQASGNEQGENPKNKPEQ